MISVSGDIAALPHHRSPSECVLSAARIGASRPWVPVASRNYRANDSFQMVPMSIEAASPTSARRWSLTRRRGTAARSNLLQSAAKARGPAGWRDDGSHSIDPNTDAHTCALVAVGCESSKRVVDRSG